MQGAILISLMFTTPKYNAEQIDKIGNAIVYLAEKIPHLSKTKLLKLSYILEEESARRWGLPFCNIKFELWKMGPVSYDMYEETSNRPIGLAPYISNSQKKISPKIKFSDDEFTDAEIALMDEIIKEYGKMSARSLIEYTHREDSLWTKTAKENGVYEALEQGLISYYPVQLDLTRVISEEWMRERYLSQIEFLQRQKNSSALIWN